MIGIFDSGLGGLSVLAAVARALPQHDLAYFADTAHLPYGDKDEPFIRSRVLAIGHHLVERGCGCVVVACNTATAAAVAALRAELPAHIPVVGVEPGVKPAAKASRSKRIAVLATESTAASLRLARLIADHAQEVAVHIVPCPGWATQVETLHLNEPAFVHAVGEKIKPLLAAGVDQLVLGCTHYSFLAPLFTPLIEGHALRAQLVDVATAVAEQVARLAPRLAAHRAQPGALDLTATAHPERLVAALPKLGLDALTARLRMVQSVNL